MGLISCKETPEEDDYKKQYKVMAPLELWKSWKKYENFTNGFKDIRKGKKAFWKHIYQKMYGQNQSAY